MKHPLRVIGLAVLVFLFGTLAFAYAQDGQRADQAKPEQHAKQKQPAKQNQKVRQAKPTQHAQQNQKARQARPTQQAQQNHKAQQARPTRQTQRASNNGGGRIPDASFRAHFGRDHSFRINRPVMVGGSPRFQYGGYWFGFGEPWPAGWSYTDEVYVDYINGGYYLLNPVHPGVQISINIVL
jgi:uncharacterized iron-regulated membrane protein